MMETVLLLLLALGGGTSPAASPGLLAAPGAARPVTGVWRGSWLGLDGRASVPVDAVLAPGKEGGTLIAVLIGGTGRQRRSARLMGRYEPEGVRLTLPSGGALWLNVASESRLVGEVKGGAAGFVPGDGALELNRVRR